VEIFAEKNNISETTFKYLEELGAKVREWDWLRV